MRDGIKKGAKDRARRHAERRTQVKPGWRSAGQVRAACPQMREASGIGLARIMVTYFSNSSERITIGPGAGVKQGSHRQPTRKATTIEAPVGSVASSWYTVGSSSFLTSLTGRCSDLQYRYSISVGNIMVDFLSRSFFAGFIRLHILYHAGKEAICGTEIMEELQGHGHDLSPGTLYPILRQLHEAGYLSRKEKVVDGKLRKNFRITAEGRKILKEARAKVQELMSEIVEDKDRRNLNSN
jgi:DNA-binding PadR family transcriptional regulator